MKGGQWFHQDRLSDSGEKQQDRNHDNIKNKPADFAYKMSLVRITQTKSLKKRDKLQQEYQSEASEKAEATNKKGICSGEK